MNLGCDKTVIMWNETIETRGHTSKDGTLNLTVKAR